MYMYAIVQCSSSSESSRSSVIGNSEDDEPSERKQVSVKADV